MTNVTAADEAILKDAAAQKGHPKGLWVLFGTEMWERFNFYGMRALLSLFLAEALLMGKTEASIIYGGFLGLCYLTPMLGGYISDKYLGNRNCILLGGTMMGIGQMLLFTSATLYATNISLATNVMWIALLAIIFGNGFFKPNISSMVGSLYPKSQKNKLDSAFTIFYLGINVGATLGQFICPFFGDVEHEVVSATGVIETVRDLSAFKWGFLAAALAMFTGTLIFLFLKNKYVRSPEGVAIGGRPDKLAVHDDDESDHAKFTSTNIAISMTILVVVTYLLHLVLGGIGTTWIKAWLYPFIFASGISLGYLILSDKTITKVEKDRIWVLYIVCFFVMFFWGAFEQAGSSLTFIADNQTDTKIFGWAMPPAMVQNFNGLFVVIFAIPFSYFWIWMNKKRIEPISPVKQAWGLILIAIGYLIIATQVKDLGMAKLGVIWLIVLYLLHTWGELCLSPIGLSLVAKLAPRRFASLLMGVWFLGNAGGYVLTGILGALLPPTTEAYVNMEKKNINLKNILDGQKVPTGAELYTLGQEKIATTVDYDLGLKHNIDLVKIFKVPDSTLTQQQLDIIEKEKIIKVGYPTFFGFVLKNLYDFFMLFVVLCGLAGLVLYSLTPMMKKMMHGVR
jgi:proton-dependent oligopeptide transporter, POT family